MNIIARILVGLTARSLAKLLMPGRTRLGSLSQTCLVSRARLSVGFAPWRSVWVTTWTTYILIALSVVGAMLILAGHRLVARTA